MTDISDIISNKKYGEKDQEVAKKHSAAINERFNKWLVSFKFLLDQEEIDDIFSGQSEACDSIIVCESQRVSTYQRLLLDVEKNSVIKKQTELAIKQKLNNEVVKQIVAEHKQIMTDFIQGKEIDALIKIPHGFGDFVSFAYSESITITKLYEVVYSNSTLNEAILSLANNPSFCESIGKPVKNIRDTKTAIGFIGVDKCKILIPILMFKPLLKWTDTNTKLISPKIWQHMILTANATKARLAESGYKNPEEGIAIGLIRNIGHFIINNYFSLTFERTMEKMMTKYREKGLMEEYYACADISPKLSFLPEMLGELSNKLSLEIIHKIDWSNKIHLKNALIEDIEDKPVLERSLHGAALMQGRTYSVFNLMSKSKAFVDAHKTPYFAHCLLSKDAQKSISRSNPGIINK